MTGDRGIRRSARALLLDADGCLFPSEKAAYVASTDVMNALLAQLGVRRRYTAEELEREHTGRNFRAAAPLVCAENGVQLRPAVLERWVATEKEVVTRHLAEHLLPDPEVTRPLRLLADAYPLAVVSSSAAARVSACLRATGLSTLLPEERIYSAEDSLVTPVSKPDPAIYRVAAARMGVAGADALAVEDSEVGVRSAVAAGIPVLGLLQFTTPDEAGCQAARLRSAGAAAIFETWDDLAAGVLAGSTTQEGHPRVEGPRFTTSTASRADA
jgi:beta-phosphoglucomutase-like phosphatase (HAD superfamily)